MGSCRDGVKRCRGQQGASYAAAGYDDLATLTLAHVVAADESVVDVEAEVDDRRDLPRDEFRGPASGQATRPRGNEGSEYVHLARGRLRREGAAQVPGPHARCLAAEASHSSRPSMGRL